MRGGVLRPDVEDHVAGVELDVDGGVREVVHRAGLDLDLGHLGGGTGGGTGGGIAGGAAGAHASPPSSSSASSGIASTSTRPGHGFTLRAVSGKSLRNG